MTDAKLRRYFGVLLGALAAWPLVQFGFTSAVDGTPWKLFGLAMYSTVHATDVVLFERDGAGTRPLAVEQLTLEAREAVARFKRYRRVFGTLVEPERLGALVLEERPGSAELVVDVQLRRLETRSSRLVTEHTEFRYPRGAAR